MNDIELWHAWRDRADVDAITTLIERYLDMVYATAQRVLKNSHDAEEIAQECFITLLKGRIEVRESLGPWLHRVARNRALDRIKGNTRRRNRENCYGAEQPESQNTPVDDILTHVDTALEELSDEVRAALVGHYLAGRTYRDLGEYLGVSEATVRARTSKGLAQLRESLKRRGVVLSAAAFAACMEAAHAEAPATLIPRLRKLALLQPTTRYAPRFTQKALAIPILGAVLAGALLVATGIVPPWPAKPDAEAPRVSIQREVRAELPEAPTTVRSGPRAGSEVDVVVEASPANDAWTEPTSTLSGTIYDSLGKPLPGATVTAVSAIAYDFRAIKAFTAVTGIDGHYTLQVKDHAKFYFGFTSTHRSGLPGKQGTLKSLDPPGLYSAIHVYATAPGFKSMGEQIPLEAGDARDSIDFVLEPGLTMTGRVLWPDGKPAANAALCMRFFRGPEGSPLRSALEFGATDAEGYFQFGVEAPGQMALMVVAEDGHEAFFESVPADEIEIPVLTLPAMSWVQGKIAMADGSPLADARVVLQGRFAVVEEPDFERHVATYDSLKISDAYMYATYTDHAGQFAFSAAAVPDATLSVSAPGTAAAAGRRLLNQHLGPLASGEQYRVDIDLPGSQEVMTLHATIRGAISGKALEEIAITVRHESTGEKNSVYPQDGSAPGTLEWTLVQPGTYRVWPRYAYMDLGPEEASYGISFAWTAGTSRNFDFELPDPFELSILVVDPDGNPIEDAAIELVNGGTSFRSGETDDAGAYHWAHFAPGYPAFLIASKVGYTANETMAVSGEPGRNYPVETLTLYPSCGVEGIVLDGAGTPLPDAAVTLHFAADGATWVARQESVNAIARMCNTDEFGRFVCLDGIPAVPGVLTLHATDASGTLRTSRPERFQGVPGMIDNLGERALIHAPKSSSPPWLVQSVR